jgi:CRISPR/Cas system-associated exonuclease Cas4 (RecB family)
MATARRPRVKPPATKRKLTGGLKARAEVRKYETVLLGDIQAHVLTQAVADHSRRTDVIHPSEMAKADWCPRATYYRISGAEPESDAALSYGMTSIFEEGNVAHTKWQTWLAEMGRLYGLWKCPVCHKTQLGISLVQCDDCGVPTQYREVPMDAEDRYLIQGHADGAVLDLDALIEIKTIGVGTVRIEEPELVRLHTKKTVEGKSLLDLDGLWNGIKRPFPSHRRQAQVYLHIANLMGLPLSRAIFIYEYKANQISKEFSIAYEPTVTAELFELARDIKFALAEGNVVPRPDGFERDGKPCNKCPFSNICWGRKDRDGSDHPPERDAGDGQAEPGGQASARTAPDPATEPPAERVPRTARRPHRTNRRRADETVLPGDPVERVPERPGGGGRGRRTIFRRRTGEDQGPEKP